MDYQNKTIEEITKELQELNAELEERVKGLTAQLEQANKELEAFLYSVSHDLRAPLRAIDGFSKYIVEDYGSKLDSEANRLLELVRYNVQKMDELILGILSLSRISRSGYKLSEIDMTRMVKSMISEVISSEEKAKFTINIGELPFACADAAYLKQVWINLISNAVKFSFAESNPLITIGGYTEDRNNIYFIEDNGVGFNQEYAHKLFGVFQRLHKPEEFEGNGIGLAIVKRIIHLHGGKVWAESKEGQGASFFFSLPVTCSG